ncbi:MAG: conserved membrane protein of unknown function [Promethearchaeota archaeon]|nr:MAG: conserved membrane protein of unknown function [Candidatus Lokiarchaeota archaeon]
MGLQDLTPDDILYGSLSLILVVISIIVGLRILSKYFRYEQKTLITVGLSWIFITSAWWVSAFSFVLLALFDFRFNPFWYLFFENAFSPVALILWIYSFSTLIYPNRKKILFGAYLVICISFEIALIIMLNVDTELIGTGIEEGIFSSQLTPFAVGFQIFGLLTMIITGIIFSLNSLKSPDMKIKWKGRFLLMAFLSFAIGSVIEALFLLDPLSLILIRILLISSNIEFYFGFFLPDKLAKILIKENK